MMRKFLPCVSNDFSQYKVLHVCFQWFIFAIFKAKCSENFRTAAMLLF
jgi:hypothetical protein